MKILTRSLAVLAFLPLAAMAQPQMTEEQMQMLMKGATEMQTCFAKLDQAKLEAMGARAEALEKELKTMCASGERDEAQVKAVAYGREIAASDEMKQMKECSQIIQAVMPQLLSQLEGLGVEEGNGGTHVCDNL